MDGGLFPDMRDYHPRVAYFVGLSAQKLYSHTMENIGVIYAESPWDACAFEHLTDAEIQRHVMATKDGIKEAADYKIFRAVCEIEEAAE